MVQTKRLSVSSLSLLSIYNFASELISRPPRYSRRHPDNFRSGLEERGADSQHRARSKSSADSRLQDFCSLICTDGHRLHVFINQSPQNQDPHKMKQRRRHRQKKKKGWGHFVAGCHIIFVPQQCDIYLLKNTITTRKHAHNDSLDCVFLNT